MWLRGSAEIIENDMIGNGEAPLLVHMHAVSFTLHMFNLSVVRHFNQNGEVVRLVEKLTLS